MTDQFGPDGALRHLLSLQGFNRQQLTSLLDLAETYLVGHAHYAPREPRLLGRTVALLFFEPSTRTRISFHLAAARLSADVVTVDGTTSSQRKGETLLDTVRTLEAMHTDVFVVRVAEPHVPAMLAEHIGAGKSIVSAGEANRSHPTQGLLDVLTIRQRKPDFGNLCVAIVGDVRHSRVARSASEALHILGVGELRLVGPEALLPAAGEFRHAERYTELEAGIRDADVVMTLRIQRERMRDQAGLPTDTAYFERFGLTAERLRVARPDAMVMHPGPVNREVELASAVADGPRSVIASQVTNGVAVRMAVLARIAESLGGTP
ncbi:MAG TPA: aspartate carbamoyltransferase catalytic subunit [Gammaproteobacteria bacterium]|nr:aspartate carbamoyltransferase catalytic subunit [Gammaproteobacteria bacterium]